MLYAVLKPLVAVLARLYLRAERRGTEHVPRQGPVLLVSNHASVLDPPLVASMCPRAVSFLAKEELFRIPGLGGLIRALNAHPLRREGGDPRALRTAGRLLAQGRALLVFPEGTRQPEGRLGEAKPGVGMLAVTSGVPVVPTCVQGTGRAMPRGARFPRPAKVRVTFGPPLTFKEAGDDGRKERYREAAREMMRAIAQLRDQGSG